MTLQTGNKLTQTIYEYFEQYKLFTSNISITIKKQLWHSVPAQISPHLKWSRLCRNMIGWQESARQPITVNHSIWIRQRQLTEILSWLPTKCWACDGTCFMKWEAERSALMNWSQRSTSSIQQHQDLQTSNTYMQHMQLFQQQSSH